MYIHVESWHIFLWIFIFGNISVSAEIIETPIPASMGNKIVSQRIKVVEVRIHNIDASDNFAYFHAELSTSGTLKNVVGSNILTIDSISVSGPINEDDFKTLWNGTFNGKLKIINLENAVVENGIIPDYALFHTDSQFDSENGIIYPTKLEVLLLPDGITHIGRHAVAWATKLRKIRFPSTLKSIGIATFTNCYSLTCKSFTLPESLEELGDQVFYECRNLNGEISLPKFLKYIDSGVFYACGLTKATIPQTLLHLGSFAFMGCNLQEAILPDDCRLGTSGCQFRGNWEIKKVHLPESLKTIPSQIFYDCLELDDVNIPPHLEVIEDFAFHQTAIKEITFPPTLREIGLDAFQSCYLKTLVLPPSVTILGFRAFEGTRLESVYSMATTPPTCERSPYDETPYPFIDLPSSTPIYVPIGTKDLYINVPGWNTHSNYIETNEFPYSSIAEVDVDNEILNHAIYDLTGRKVLKTTPGQIYIINGQKIMAK